MNQSQPVFVPQEPRAEQLILDELQLQTLESRRRAMVRGIWGGIWLAIAGSAAMQILGEGWMILCMIGGLRILYGVSVYCANAIGSLNFRIH